ncbi:hypothetical protein [Microbaculum marinum]|uniref:Strictosidine synthase conserved region domain-containing protein n=1 Tax=Microbaculum marinum TaxID=1764581 RepID=A0AAW9RIP1_9HYPH
MFGRRAEAQPSFPLLDGPLRPNDALEEAEAIPVAEPHDMCIAADGSLLVSSGASLLRMNDWGDGGPVRVAEFGGAVTALACRDDGLAAVGIEGEGVKVLDADFAVHDGLYETDTRPTGTTALVFASNGDLLAADAGRDGGAYPYTRELFADSGGGRILRISENGTTTTVASQLRCPHGMVETSAGSLVISECWASGLRTTGPEAGFNELPGNPGRIHRRQSGGYLLACLSRRDPLIDFIRTEEAFAARMMAEIEPEYWVAPRLSAQADYRYPVQSGATRLFGETKPWAPSLSYGLVVLLDTDFQPGASLHSRANGTRHGITTAVEWRGGIVALSRGSGELLRVKGEHP